MRHRKLASKLGRTSAHRKALYRNLVTSLFEHERIETTDAKAKALRRVADRIITLGKRGDLHARRQAMQSLRSREVAAKVFGELAERFRERPGGYTRVVKLRNRTGDAAAVSIIELVGPMESGKPAGKKAARKKATAKKAAEETKSKKAATKKTAAKKAAASEGEKKKSTRKKASKKSTAKE